MGIKLLTKLKKNETTNKNNKLKLVKISCVYSTPQKLT